MTTSGKVVVFPRARTRTPDEVVVERDFGLWCVRLRAGGRFIGRTQHVDEVAARAEADRIAAEFGIAVQSGGEP